MKQDSLYTLIKRMTKQEKIFFNRFAQIANNKKEKHYLTLFRLIEKQLKKDHSVDETKLKKTFPYLSVEKRYLMNVLLRSLTLFHEKDEGFYVVKTMMKQIHILLDKGIYSEAQRLHTKATALAEKYDLFEDLLILNNLKMVLRDYMGFFLNTEAMAVNMENKRQLIEKIVNYDEYRLFMYELFTWIKENGYIDSDQKKIAFQEKINTPLIEDISNAKSAKAIELYYNARVIILELQYDIEGRYNEFQDRIAFMNTHTHLYSPFNRIIFTNNYLLSCIRIGAVEECEKQLSLLEDLISCYPLRSGLINGFLYMRRLEFYSSIGAFEKNRVWIKTVEKGLATYNDFGKRQEEEIHLFLGRAYIEIESYEKALDYLYKVGNYKIFTQASVTYSAARLLMLICYYELKWFSNLESAILSFYRQIRKEGVQYRLYDSLLKYLKLRIANKDLTNKNTLYFFSSEWEGIRLNSKESIPFQFFHYKKWLKSKIEKKPLSAYFNN